MGLGKFAEQLFITGFDDDNRRRQMQYEQHLRNQTQAQRDYDRRHEQQKAELARVRQEANKSLQMAQSVLAAAKSEADQYNPANLPEVRDMCGAVPEMNDLTMMFRTPLIVSTYINERAPHSLLDQFPDARATIQAEYSKLYEAMMYSDPRYSLARESKIASRLDFSGARRLWPEEREKWKENFPSTLATYPNLPHLTEVAHASIFREPCGWRAREFATLCDILIKAMLTVHYPRLRQMSSLPIFNPNGLANTWVAMDLFGLFELQANHLAKRDAGLEMAESICKLLKVFANTEFLNEILPASKGKEYPALSAEVHVVAMLSCIFDGNANYSKYLNETDDAVLLSYIKISNRVLLLNELENRIKAALASFDAKDGAYLSLENFGFQLKDERYLSLMHFHTAMSALEMLRTGWGGYARMFKLPYSISGYLLDDHIRNRGFTQRGDGGVFSMYEQKAGNRELERHIQPLLDKGYSFEPKAISPELKAKQQKLLASSLEFTERFSSQ